MNLTEQRNRTIDLKNSIEQRMEPLFNRVEVNGKLRFKEDSGRVFSLFTFPNDGAIGIEYAENMNEALLNRFEDGDLFYLADMDEDTMFQAMLNEINN